MELANYFKESSKLIEALAHDVRRDIVIELAKNYPNALRICEIKTKKCITRPSLSHHFKVLVNAHVINYYHKGTKNFYYLSIDEASIDDCLNLLNRLKDFVGVKNDSSN